MNQGRQWRLGAVGGPYAVLVLTFAVSLFVAAGQIMPASVLTLIMGDLGIEPSAAGWLVSLTMLAPALLALPVGFGLDRLDNRRIFLLGGGLVALSNVLGWYAAAGNLFPELLATRFLAGVGTIMSWTAGANLVSATFKGPKAATATGVYTASAPLGYVVGQAVPPLVAGRTTWEANFLLFGATITAASVLFAAVAYRAAELPMIAQTASLRDFQRVLANRAVWAVALMSFAAYSLNLLFNSWMPTYLATELGFSIADSGVLVALFPAMGVLSRTSGGYLSDRFLSQRRRPISIASFLLTIPLVIGMVLTDVPVVVVALLVLSGYFVQLGIGLFYTHVRELVDEHVAGSALAVLTMASFGGGFVAPVIAGWLIEQTGVYLSSFAFAGGLAVMGVVLGLLAPEP